MDRAPARWVLWVRDYSWWLIVILAVITIVHIDRVRAARVEFLSDVSTWSVAPPEPDATSPTGYSGGRRRLIVPGHHGPSYRWILQTQDMLRTGDIRQRHVDFDNAPEGRASYATMPYRLWLAGVAWCDSLVSGRSPALAVEHASLYADSILHILLLVSAAAMAARRLGPAAGTIVAIGIAGLYPLAGAFQPGAPDEHALAWSCVLWSVLALVNASVPSNRRDSSHRGFSRPWVVVSGITGGAALWVDVTVMMPVLAGVGLSALVGIGLTKGTDEAGRPPPSLWRWWAVSGAITALSGSLLEFFPSHLGWGVPAIHPLHALAWLGLGQILSQCERWRQEGSAAWDRRSSILSVGSVLAVAALPIVMAATETGRFLADDPLASELVNMANGAMAPSVDAWLRSAESSTLFWATFLPAIAVVVVVLFTLIIHRVPEQLRRVPILLLGPATAATLIAFAQLRWWNGVDVIVVAFAATTVGAVPRLWWRLGWCGLFALLVLPGFRQLLPSDGSRAGDPVRPSELQMVVERDLAYWLRQESGDDPPTVLTTPALTESLAFYSGIRGIGTFDWENKEGLSAAVRMASASTTREAAALFDSRGVTRLVVPSWDPTLREFIRLGRQVPMGTPLPANAFMVHIERWDLPDWVRAVPYHLPPQEGFRDLSVAVFAKGIAQDEPLATCRLASYFIEMGRLREASSLRKGLELYPRDLSALSAIAQIDLATSDREAFQKSLEKVIPYLARRSARLMPPDLRIGLAAMLVQAGQKDAARTQMQQCVSAMNADQIRFLSTGARVRLLAMSNLFALALPNPESWDLTLSLLPPGVRAQVEHGSTADRTP